MCVSSAALNKLEDISVFAGSSSAVASARKHFALCLLERLHSMFWSVPTQWCWYRPCTVHSTVYSLTLWYDIDASRCFSALTFITA